MSSTPAVATVESTAGEGVADQPTERSWARRIWGLPLWAQSVLLLVLLVVMIPVARFDVSFSSDEGTAILQAQRLSAGQPYLRANEFPTVDPDGRAFFVTLSEGGPQKFATYAKHPAYAWMLAGADRVGGAFVMTLLSAVATALAALAAALIARRWDPALDRWALWVVGVGSPLFFDSQIVLAHSIGAALAGFAALLALVVVERRRWAATAGIATLLATAAFFRSESLLFAIAVGLTLFVIGIRRKRFDLAASAVLIVIVAGAATVLDRYWVGQILERGTAPLNTIGSSFLSGRLSSTASTFILPGATWPPYVYYGLLAMLVALIATAMLARRQPLEGRLFHAGCGVVIIGGLLPLLATPDTIGSLLITCPVLTAGWCLLSRADVNDDGRRMAVAICCLYTLAVLVTQYSEAGAAEWGARFLAMMLPLAIPIALVAMRRVGPTLPRFDRRLAAGTLAAVTLSMAILSITSLRHYRGATDDWLLNVRQAEAVTAGADLGDGDRRPIVVTTWAGLGRMTWPLDPPPRGLTIPPESVTDYTRMLRDKGVKEFVLAANDPAADLQRFAGFYAPAESFPRGRTGSTGPVFVMRAT